MNQIDKQKILSISIPTWNRDILLQELLVNITEQIAKHHLEDKIDVYVSDNDSNDTTKAVVHSFMERCSYMSYHKNDSNIGLGPNVTQSMLLANGKYTLLLGDDDRLKSDCLPSLITYLEQHPDTGLLVDTTDAKKGKVENITNLSLEQFLKTYYWFMGNAGVFVTLTSYTKDNFGDPKIKGVSFSWPQTQLMIIGSYKNPQNKIMVGNFNLIGGTEHANITLYNSYYLWKVSYYELVVDIENLRDVVSKEVVGAGRQYFIDDATQKFFNVLQCGVYLDSNENKKKTRDHISKHLGVFSAKEQRLLKIILFVLWLPAPIARILSDVFIFLIRGKAGLEKKNNFVKQEKKKMEIINSKKKTIIRQFSFEGAPS